MSEQGSGKEKNYYARVAWIFFLVSFIVYVVVHRLSSLPSDAVVIVWIVVFLCVVVPFIIRYFSPGAFDHNRSKWKIFSRIYGIGVCPLFFTITLVSFFVAWPLSDAEIMYPYGKPWFSTAVEIKGLTFYSPFNYDVAEYSLSQSTVHDSVYMYYDFDGSAIKFHIEYGWNNTTAKFSHRVDSIYVEAIEEFKRTHQGATKLQLLCWLDCELPGRLPPDARYDGRLSLLDRVSLSSPVGINDE